MQVLIQDLLAFSRVGRATAAYSNVDCNAVIEDVRQILASAITENKAVLAHNRDEEKEHAAMVLEWLRRRDPALDANLRKYLFTEEPLTALVAKEKAEPPAPVAPDGHLGIGDLRRAANED